MPGIFSFAVTRLKKRAATLNDSLPWALIFGSVLLSMLMLKSNAFSTEPDACILPLEGTHRFAAGDAPEWKSEEYADSAWTPVQVPGSWQSQKLATHEGMGWYRLHFSTSIEKFRYMDGFLGLRLGKIGNADEVFLNGHRIGGEGVIGDQFVEAPRKERLYRIPKGLLRFEGENLVAVRVLNTYQSGGILTGPVCIGEYGRLLADCHQRETTQDILEVSIMAVFAVSILAGAFLSPIGPRDIQFVVFTVFVLLCGITFVFDSLLFYQTGLKNCLVQRAITMLTFLVSGAGLLLLTIICREPREAWLWTVIVSFVSIGVVAWFSTTRATYWMLVEIWHPLSLVALCRGIPGRQGPPQAAV